MNLMREKGTGRLDFLPGFMLAAPQSGSGKTTVTLGLLRAFKRAGLPVAPAKAGPDFIDPAFHRVASGEACFNLDPWAMRDGTIDHLALTQLHSGALVVEAMMGLFDGAASGKGSAADLAGHLGLPVVLVVDAAKQSHSVAALVSGFRDFRPEIVIAGCILNRVGSARHEIMLREALEAIDMPVFGVVPRDERLVLPSRHLGLVQAQENRSLEQFIENAARIIESSVDLMALAGLSFQPPDFPEIPQWQPPGGRIAVARDEAFSFAYAHQLEAWRLAGAQISFFSPLADEAPAADSDAVFLPGGYPELHAFRLSAAQHFIKGLQAAAGRGAFVYGECGGYMVLGEALIDAKGQRHTMAGLLPLVTSFAERKMHLGYRNAALLQDLPFGKAGSLWACHEFHYSQAVQESPADGASSLFSAVDARGENLGECGLRKGNVAGSYLHVIDRR